MLSALCCGMLLTGNAFAATSAYRSLELKGTDESTMIVNIEAEMNLTFANDSMFVTTPDYQLAFANSDYRSWTFSTKWNPVPVIPEEPPVVPPTYEAAGDGSWQTPYNTLALAAAEASEEKVWLTGFIVGSFSGSSMTNANFTEDGHMTSNIILAPAPDVTDLELCVPVRFTGDFCAEVRDSLNLRETPENLGMEVSIRGLIAEVGGVQGLNTTTHFNWGNVGFEAQDPEPEQPVAINAVENDKAQWSRTAASIDFASLPAGSTVELYDIKGQRLTHINAEGSASISLSNLPNGIYLMNVNGKTVKIAVSR